MGGDWKRLGIDKFIKWQITEALSYFALPSLPEAAQQKEYSMKRHSSIRPAGLHLWASCLVALCLINPPPAFALFSKSGEISLTTGFNHHGLAFDGNYWHIANALNSNFRTYDASFNYVSTTTITGFTDTRGLTFDPNSGHLFVGDLYGMIREVSTTGVVIQGFSIPSNLNALAYDARDNSIWIADYSGLIEHRTRTGSFLSSFTGSRAWTGLALDTVNNTLLALEDGDTLYEYRLDGTLIGQIIPTDQIYENGQGLAYDSLAGRLYATTQAPGRITIFNDPSRVPEPTGFSLLCLSSLALAIAAGGRAKAP